MTLSEERLREIKSLVIAYGDARVAAANGSRETWPADSDRMDRAFDAVALSLRSDAHTSGEVKVNYDGDQSELLEWRNHDSSSEITYTGFGPYMVEKLSEDSFRIWLPDDTKNARIMVGGFASRKDARAACQSNADGRRGAFRAISGDAVSLEAALGREEASVEYWWARAKDAEQRLSQLPVVADALEWKAEPSGLSVATLHLGEHSMIELSKASQGRSGIQLTIHTSREDAGRWEDMSATLTPTEAAQLAQAISPATSVAAEMLAALKMAKLWTDPEWVAWEHICKAIDRAEGRQP